MYYFSLSLSIYTQYWLTGHKRQQQSKHVLVLKLLFQILSREAFVKACRISWIPMTCYIHIYIHIITSCELDSYYMLYIYITSFRLDSYDTLYIYIITPCRFYSYNVVYISIYLYLSIYHTIHIHHHTLQVLFPQCDIYIYLYLSIYIYLPISIYLSHYTYTSSHLAGFIPTMWYISIYIYLSIYLSITSCR